MSTPDLSRIRKHGESRMTDACSEYGEDLTAQVECDVSWEAHEICSPGNQLGRYVWGVLTWRGDEIALKRPLVGEQYRIVLSVHFCAKAFCRLSCMQKGIAMPRAVGGASVGYGVQTPAIECRGLTKRYGSHRGIEGVDLTVERGEIFGFIGPNGAGKSTTIRCLLGLVHKTSGEARVLGFDIERERTAILARTGYLPSEVAFYDRMRARELLRYAASFYLDSAACLERAHELSERLELDEDARVDDMSLGNRKKVGIVVSLMHAPDLLVLDEPTSGLDPLVQREFFDIVREENARGVTVLFSSHVLSEVQRICGRVAVIRQGRIVDVRSVAELRASAIKQVHVLTGDGREESFVHQGSCNVLVERLSRLDVADLEVGEPSLEELFLHYYEDGAEEPDGADQPMSLRRSGLGAHAEASRRKGGLR